MFYYRSITLTSAACYNLMRPQRNSIMIDMTQFLSSSANPNNVAIAILNGERFKSQSWIASLCRFVAV